VTRNNQTDRFTIEKLAHDCLDIRELRRRDFLTDRRVAGRTKRMRAIIETVRVEIISFGSVDESLGLTAQVTER
jgi:hypothetical protein